MQGCDARFNDLTVVANDKLIALEACLVVMYKHMADESPLQLLSFFEPGLLICNILQHLSRLNAGPKQFDHDKTAPVLTWSGRGLGFGLSQPHCGNSSPVRFGVYVQQGLDRLRYFLYLFVQILFSSHISCLVY